MCHVTSVGVCVCHVPSVGVCVSAVHRVTLCLVSSPVRGVCVASHLWACVCPLSSVLLFAWFPVLYVGCVSRPICGRECVPCPLYNRVFSAVRGVCVTSHLWACVCPPSTVKSLCGFWSVPGVCFTSLL